MYDLQEFFSRIRSLSPRLSQTQVDGFNAVLNAAPPDMPERHLAYCLATAWHETAFTMKPIEEYGKGKGKPYGPSGFWGRGYVQLTWRDNYARAGAELGLNLVGQPELALRADIAARILFEGMREGWFTGRKLADYFGPSTDDPLGARRIINGVDRAAQVAAYHHAFLSALAPAPASASPVSSQPEPVPRAQDGFWSAFRAALNAKFGRMPT